MQDVYKLTERPSRQVKELHQISESAGIGLYSIKCYWEESPEEESFLGVRIGYDERKNTIEFLDFSDGPMIYPGYELEPGVQIMGFTEYDGDIKKIKVIVENGVSN